MESCVCSHSSTNPEQLPVGLALHRTRFASPVTDDASQKENYKGQKALREWSQGLTCLILGNNFKTYFKFCYKWGHSNHEQEDQNITKKGGKKKKDDDITRRKINTIRESHVLCTDWFSGGLVCKATPTKKFSRGENFMENTKKLFHSISQMCYEIISHTRNNNNHPVKHSFYVPLFCTHVHTHTYLYVLLHTHIYMDRDL